MADSTETRALLLQINATTELLRSQLTAAEKATADFQSATQRHLDNVDDRFDLLGKSLEKLEAPLERLKGLGEVAIGAILGESLLEAGKKSLEFAGNIQFVAEQAKVSTDFLQKFQYAASQFGVSNSSANEALDKFARSVGEVANGNKGLTETFDRLGVKVRDAGGNVRSVEAIFLDTIAGIKKFDAPAQATADTLQLMGKSAAGMVPLMSQGPSGFNQLAAAAEQLGVVLSPELIEHSEQVNHKLAALKEIVDAQLASAVAQNAGNIETMANAIVHLSGALAKFLSANPERAVALLGALAGGKLGGVPGALIGGAAGAVAGAYLNQQQKDESKDPDVRLQQLLAARNKLQGSLTTYKNTNGVFVDPADMRAQIAEVRRQLGLYAGRARAPVETSDLGSTAPGATNANTSAAITAEEKTIASLRQQAAGKSGAVLAAYNEEIAQHQRIVGYLKQGATSEMASQLASKQNAAEKKGEGEANKAARIAAEEQKKADEQTLAYTQEELKLRKAILEGAKKNAATDAERDQLARDVVNAEADAEKARINGQRQQVYDDPNSTAEMRATADKRAEHLLQLNEQNRTQQLINVDLARASQKLQDELDATELDLQGQQALLHIQDQLALTRKERLKAELKLLDLSEQAAKAEQQRILDDKSGKYSDADRDRARTTIGQIDAQHAGNVALIQRQNAGPLEAYKNELRSSVGDINDALESVEVDGLKGLEDGLAGVITGTKSLKQAFSEMAASIIQDLVKIGIEKSILGGLGGGGGGGLFGSIFGGLGGGGANATYAALDLPLAFADGGQISGPGGPRTDSILAAVSNGEFIVNADAAKKNLALLHAINDNKVPRFADGGIVGPRISAPKLGPIDGIGRGRDVIYVQVDKSDLFDAHVQSIAGPVAAQQVQSAAPQIAAAGGKLGNERLAKRQRRSLLRPR